MSLAKFTQLVRSIGTLGDEAGHGRVTEQSTRTEAGCMTELERTVVVEQLFRHHRTALLKYLTRLLSNSDDAEEVLQETYVRLLRAEHLDHLDEQVSRFLFTIATNLARDRFRQRKSRSEAMHIPHELIELVSQQDAPDEIIDWDRGIQLIKQALLDLPPRHRQVFLLHVTQSMSYGTIARHLGISAKTVQRDIAMVLELCQSRITGRDR
jgi:RNA polymerase sigma factor (sigma-70 family)